LSRLLTSPGVEVEARTLGAPDPALDTAARAAMEHAVAEAYARGRRDGAAEAGAAVDQAAGRVVAALQRADADLRAVAAAADVALARAIAGAVVDREPSDDGAALLARVGAALAALDDEAVVVHLSPAEAPVLRDAVARQAAAVGAPVEVVADAAVPPGEALLAGRWARADLTRAGAWAALDAVLGGEAGA
jgi:flagellar biosynthesis/type III secretory pathway protein FliH